MTRKGPLVTLLSGGALAAVLLMASINAADEQGDPDPALAGDATATEQPPPPEAEESPTPDPTEEDEDEGDRADEGGEEPEPVVYVGYVDDGTASVAIAVTGDEATAYVCDGAEIEAWLTGSVRNGELLLSGDADATLTGSFDDDRAQGETTVQGQDFDFTIEFVESPEGLYRFADTVAGAEVEGGWIVLPDGTQVGLLTVDGETVPAPAINPVTGRVIVDGQLITTEPVG